MAKNLTDFKTLACLPGSDFILKRNPRSFWSYSTTSHTYLPVGKHSVHCTWVSVSVYSWDWMWRHVAFIFLSPVPPVWHSYFIVNPCNPGQPDIKVHAPAIIPIASQRTERKITGMDGWMSIHIPCHSSHPEYPFLSCWDFSSLLWKVSPLIPTQSAYVLPLCLSWPFCTWCALEKLSPLFTLKQSVALRSFFWVCLLVYPESALSLYFPLQVLLSHRRCISRWTEQGPGQRSSSPGPNCVPLGISLCLCFFT